MNHFSKEVSLDGNNLLPVGWDLGAKCFLLKVVIFDNFHVRNVSIQFNGIGYFLRGGNSIIYCFSLSYKKGSALKGNNVGWVA